MPKGACTLTSAILYGKDFMGPICRADYTIASVQNIERNNAHKYRAFGRDRNHRAHYRAVHFIEVQIIESRLYIEKVHFFLKL